METKTIIKVVCKVLDCATVGYFVGIWWHKHIIYSISLLIIFLLVNLKPFYWFRIKLLRKLSWKSIKRRVESSVNHPLLAYSQMIWLEFEGKEIFINQGVEAFIAAHSKYIDKFIKRLTQKPARLKRRGYLLRNYFEHLKYKYGGSGLTCEDTRIINELMSQIKT